MIFCYRGLLFARHFESDRTLISCRTNRPKCLGKSYWKIIRKKIPSKTYVEAPNLTNISGRKWLWWNSSYFQWRWRLYLLPLFSVTLPCCFCFANKAAYTAQKMKFSIKDFFSKCEQIRGKLRIWSHSLRKSLMENFIFCAVIAWCRRIEKKIVTLFIQYHYIKEKFIMKD